jgi:hypothetical protein
MDYPQTPFRDVAERDIARLSGANVVVPSKESASIENIRFWEQDQSIRVVVDLAGDITFVPGEAKSPERFFVDIAPARLTSMLMGREWVVDSKLIQRIRVAQYDESTGIVLDGTTLKDVTTSNLKEPNRLVMDVAPPSDAPPPRTITRRVPHQYRCPRRPLRQCCHCSRSGSCQLPPTCCHFGFRNDPSDSCRSAVYDCAARGIRSCHRRSTNTGDRSLIRSLGLKLYELLSMPVTVDDNVGSTDRQASPKRSLFSTSQSVSRPSSRLRWRVVMTRDADAFVPWKAELRWRMKKSGSVHLHSRQLQHRQDCSWSRNIFPEPQHTSRDCLATAARENAALKRRFMSFRISLQKIVLNAKTDESRELAEYIQSAMSKRKFAGKSA